MKDLKTETYSVSEPSYNQNGASMTVYFNDDTQADIDVEMEWDGRRDELKVVKIDADYYDDEGNLLNQESLDLEKLVFNIFENFQTFGKVENEMLKAYHADHQ